MTELDNETDEGLSMEEKLHKAFCMSIDIHNKSDANELTIPKDFMDNVYGHLDGLTSQHIHKMVNGECSLQAQIDWDIEAAEAQLDKDIENMGKLLNSEPLNSNEDHSEIGI